MQLAVNRTRCAHCGLPVEATGADPVYCCAGCEGAAAIVHAAGLEAWYTRRTATPDRPAPADVDWSAVPVVDQGGTCEARLVIGGLRCGACAWLNEKALADLDGVVSAHVSHASGRALVRWDPSRTDLPSIGERVAALGYRPRADLGADPPDRGLLLRLGVACFAAMNGMMVAAPVYLGWALGMSEPYQVLFRWAALVLATPVALWCAEPFYVGAVASLRRGLLHVDLPVSLAVVVLYAHGVWATFSGHDGYLDSLGMLVALLLAGRVLEQRGRERAAEAVRLLANQGPKNAVRVLPGGIERVSVEDLDLGDRVEVGAGGEIPVDGSVVRGRALVAMALLTGESEPRPVGVGERVVAGAVLEQGHLVIEVEARSGERLLERVGAQVLAAVERPRSPGAADRLPPWFTASTLLIAGGTCFAWRGDSLQALEATVAVLVVACPCALALAEPLATAAGLRAAARRGLLLRDGQALQRLAEVDRVALDKTGTLTGGRLEVVEASDETLALAAAVERASVHPVGRAIVDACVERGLPVRLAADIREEAHVGITGRLDGRWVRVRGAGAGRVEVVGHGEVVLRDRLRPGVGTLVQSLGLPVVLITGDAPEVAERIGREAGVSQVLAGLDPEAKRRFVEAHPRTLFVGDGLNDGPALAAAHVGLAMEEGAATSLVAADGAVLGNGLAPVLAGLRVGRATARTVRRNLVRSVAYNVVAVAAAALGFVDPLVAALLMPLSSGLVLASAAGLEARVARLEGA